MAQERVLITGGAGFVGSHLTERLLDEGYRVRILDVLDPQVHGPDSTHGHLDPSVRGSVEMIRADVRDERALRRSLRDVEIVVHLAAQVGVGQSMYQIQRYVDVNTNGTGTLLQLLSEGGHSVNRLLVASSMSAYGEGAYHCSTCGSVSPTTRSHEQLMARQWEPACPRCGAFSLSHEPTRETKQLSPTSVYAVTKRSQEELCLSVGGAYGIATTALRLFNIYGPRQSLSNPYTGVVAIFVSRFRNNKPPIIFEDGRQVRDFVHVGDVAQAFLRTMESEAAAGEVFNVGSGDPVEVLDIAQAIGEVMGVPHEPKVTQAFREGDIRHCYADISKIRNMLGYEPSVTFAQGVKALVDWSLSQQQAPDTFDSARVELERRNLITS